VQDGKKLTKKDDMILYATLVAKRERRVFELRIFTTFRSIASTEQITAEKYGDREVNLH